MLSLYFRLTRNDLSGLDRMSRDKLIEKAISAKGSLSEMSIADVQGMARNLGQFPPAQLQNLNPEAVRFSLIHFYIRFAHEIIIYDNVSVIDWILFD